MVHLMKKKLWREAASVIHFILLAGRVQALTCKVQAKQTKKLKSSCVCETFYACEVQAKQVFRQFPAIMICLCQQPCLISTNYGMTSCWGTFYALALHPQMSGKPLPLKIKWEHKMETFLLPTEYNWKQLTQLNTNHWTHGCHTRHARKCNSM